jgi:flagellar hook-associated protein 1 FlgK
MPSTFWGLGIGTSGLYVNQTGLNTTAHNITNAETKGYSLQSANQSASTPISINTNAGMAGTGVIITSVTQIRSAYFDSKYRENNSIAGEYNTKSQYMTEIENYLNELNDDGFTKTFNSFYESMQELSKNPSDLTVRNSVIGFGKTFTEYFNSLSESLSSTQTSLNFEVRNQVDKVNTIAQQIATLNQQINRVEINGQNANDIRDKRNVLIDELSQIVNVTTQEYKSEDATGLSTFRVLIDGNSLVESGEFNTLTVEPRTNDEKVNLNDVDGLYDIKWTTGNDFNIRSSTLTGTLKSVIDVRDGNNNENLQGKIAAATAGATSITLEATNINDINKLNIPQNGTIVVGNNELTYDSFSISKDASGKYSYTFNLNKPLTDAVAANTTAKIGNSIDYKGIPYYMSKMNEFVRTYATSFNSIHKGEAVDPVTGKDTRGEDLNGDYALDFFNGVNPTTGKNYVLSSDVTTLGTSYYNITAANFTVTSEFLTDPKKLATTTDIKAGVENKSIIDGLLKLKDGKTMFKQGSPSQFLQSFVADVGVDTNTASNFAKSQTNILNAVTNQRLSVSGVDTDEEALKLVKYQQGFNMCSHVITVMDEVLDKLINGTGV